MLPFLFPFSSPLSFPPLTTDSDFLPPFSLERKNRSDEIFCSSLLPISVGKVGGGRKVSEAFESEKVAKVEEEGEDW